MQKTITIIILGILSFAVFNCKKKQGDSENARYAKYAAAVYSYEIKEGKDRKTGKPKPTISRKWKATLAKGEKVNVLPLQEKDKKIVALAKSQLKIEDLVKVQLSDETTGFIEERHLAGPPLVIVEDGVKVYTRPGSSVYTELPVGTLCNTLDVNQKAHMLKVYCGAVKVGGKVKYVTKHWIKQTGYSVQPSDIETARQIEKAARILEKEGPDSDKGAEALETLANIRDSGSALASAASEILAQFGADQPEGSDYEGSEENYDNQGSEQNNDQSSDMESDSTSDATDQ